MNSEKKVYLVLICFLISPEKFSYVTNILKLGINIKHYQTMCRD